MQLLCIAAEGEPYGYVKFGSQIPSIKELCKLINPHPRPADLARWIAELERHEVLKRAPDGSMSSPRQVRVISESRTKTSAANARWIKQTTSPVHMQKHGSASIESDTESEHTPPRKKGGVCGAYGEGARSRVVRFDGARTRALASPDQRSASTTMDELRRSVAEANQRWENGGREEYEQQRREQPDHGPAD